jgi:hypothetical protein
MKTINDPNNPVMIIETQEARTQCYFNDIGAHIQKSLEMLREIAGPPPVDALMHYVISTASDEDIEKFEEQTGIAVPRFEEAVKLYNAKEGN